MTGDVINLVNFNTYKVCWQDTFFQSRQNWSSFQCLSLQDVVRCFWSNRNCEGQQIRRWRGWVLMVATLEKFLDVCPIDDEKLQKLYNYLPADCKNIFSMKYYSLWSGDTIMSMMLAISCCFCVFQLFKRSRVVIRCFWLPSMKQSWTRGQMTAFIVRPPLVKCR